MPASRGAAGTVSRERPPHDFEGAHFPQNRMCLLHQALPVTSRGIKRARDAQPPLCYLSYARGARQHRRRDHTCRGGACEGRGRELDSLQGSAATKHFQVRNVSQLPVSSW